MSAACPAWLSGGKPILGALPAHSWRKAKRTLPKPAVRPFETCPMAPALNQGGAAGAPKRATPNAALRRIRSLGQTGARPCRAAGHAAVQNAPAAPKTPPTPGNRPPRSLAPTGPCTTAAPTVRSTPDPTLPAPDASGLTGFHAADRPRQSSAATARPGTPRAGRAIRGRSRQTMPCRGCGP